jgi:hypothetical protein
MKIANIALLAAMLLFLSFPTFARHRHGSPRAHYDSAHHLRSHSHHARGSHHR